MENTEELSQEEKLRSFFRDLITYYVRSGEKANLPSCQEELEEIIENAEFETFIIPSTTGTFRVNRKKIDVVMNNFEKNGSERNIFLLLHEFTHLISSVNAELFSEQKALVEKLKQMATQMGYDEDMYFDAYYGLTAVDEVLAQWTAEEHNDAMKGKKRETTTYTKGPLDSNVTFTSDFSDQDIYSPLQTVVESFVKELGFSSLREFATAVFEKKITITDRLDRKQFYMLSQIGIILEGISLDNGFNNTLNTTKEEVEQAFQYLSKFEDLGENPGGDAR